MKPNKESFSRLAGQYNVVPVCAQVLADMETPVSCLSKLEAAFDDCFLLESAENVNRWGRYSFLGCSPKAVFTLNGGEARLKFSGGREVKSASREGLAPLAPLREYLASRRVAKIAGLPDFVGGAVGYFGYECAGMFERLPEPKGERVWDDARLALYDDIIVFDNLRHAAKIVACAHIDEYENVDAAYAGAVARVERLVEIF